MSLTSILSAEAIENAVKDCQGTTSSALPIFKTTHYSFKCKQGNYAEPDSYPHLHRNSFNFNLQSSHLIVIKRSIILISRHNLCCIQSLSDLHSTLPQKVPNLLSFHCFRYCTVASPLKSCPALTEW